MCIALGIPQCSFYQWSRQEDKRNERLVDINEYKLRRIMRENELYSIVVKKFKSYKPGKGYRTMLNELKIEPSMSAPGCPYDNAAMENFFASLKKVLIYRRSYAGMDEVREDIFKYIELFYNRKRLHCSLGYMSPVAYRLQKLSA